jgi:hypothetical protein
MEVKIPVLPHVKSLMLSIYGPEPIKANENNLLGKEVQSILLSYSQTELFQQKLVGESITIILSERIAQYYKKFSNAFDLGCMFEKQFHAIMFAHIEAQKQLDVPVMKAIKNFFTKYKIDDELYSMGAAQQSYLRMIRLETVV